MPEKVQEKGQRRHAAYGYWYQVCSGIKMQVLVHGGRWSVGAGL